MSELVTADAIDVVVWLSVARDVHASGLPELPKVPSTAFVDARLTSK